MYIHTYMHTHTPHTYTHTPIHPYTHPYISIHAYTITNCAAVDNGCY